MTIESLAKKRMIAGRKSHADQVPWEELDAKYLLKEAQEELADCWNYVHKMKTCRRIRYLIKHAYALLE